MHDAPPTWLKDVVAQHRPIFQLDDLVCMCSCDGSQVSWTPEHMTREIHACVVKAVDSLYV